MSTIAIAPEVADFLAAVRTHLADLDPEEQREILDGLEADLTELVTEQGAEALGDPGAYAAELRQAAGIAPEVATRRGRRLAPTVHMILDSARSRGSRVAGALPEDVVAFGTALRPVWWVLRAWIAVQAGILWFGGWALTIVPHDSLLGAAVLAVAVVGSVQLGRRRLWPHEGWRTHAGARVLLLGLNGLTVVMLPIVLNGLQHHDTRVRESAYEQGQAETMRMAEGSGPKAGLYSDGTWVSNIYAYDAQGRPLVGVQLFNQIGQPINVVTQAEYPKLICEEQCVAEDGVMDANGNPMPRVFYPWNNGATQLFNVFPIPSRVQESEELSPTAFAEKDRPAVGSFPLASVPEVSLPGVQTGAVEQGRVRR